MLRYDRDFQRLAFCLAALAGFVDAIGFLKTGGLFVSFMSGNSTRLAIGLLGATAMGFAAAALIGLFVCGVVLNVLLAAKITIAHRKVVAMATVALLLGLAGLSQAAGLDLAAIAALCLAMGASNTVFRRDGEVSIGVTYMTGTLVKLGDRIANAALGGDRLAWLPYLLLWLALLVGGILGTTAYGWSADASIWIAAACAALLVPITHRLCANRPA